VRTYGWNWSSFKGSKKERRLNYRDLPTVDVAARLCPQRRVAVQAGGNLGLFPKRLAMLFGTVYTFEPHPHWFEYLCHNAPETNIVRINKALSNSEAGVALSDTRRDGKDTVHEGCTHIVGPGDVPAARLDSLHLADCDLICLDVEGHEMQALEGAKDTIARCHPVLCVEVTQKPGGHREDELRGLIGGMGYGRVRRIWSDEIYVPLTMEDAA